MRKINVLKILKALLENPRVSDRKIAKIVNVSQPTVTRIRTKLQERDSIRFLTMPNLHHIGMELMAFNRVYPDEGYSEDLINDPSVIYVARGLKEFMVISIHKNYHGFHLFASKYLVIESVIIPSSEELIKPLTFKDVNVYG